MNLRDICVQTFLTVRVLEYLCLAINVRSKCSTFIGFCGINSEKDKEDCVVLIEFHDFVVIWLVEEIKERWRGGG